MYISGYKSHTTFNKSCIFLSVYEGGGAALVDILNRALTAGASQRRALFIIHRRANFGTLDHHAFSSLV